MLHPPAATVTFLFTDIEGSTRLLKTLGEEYPAPFRAIWGESAAGPDHVVTIALAGPTLSPDP